MEGVPAASSSRMDFTSAEAIAADYGALDAKDAASDTATTVPDTFPAAALPDSATEGSKPNGAIAAGHALPVSAAVATLISATPTTRIAQN